VNPRRRRHARNRRAARKLAAQPVKFAWDPVIHVRELSPEQRRTIAQHERLHLEYHKIRGTMTPEQIAAHEAAIAEFESAEPEVNR